jgi:hypothetical protein
MLHLSRQYFSKPRTVHGSVAAVLTCLIFQTPIARASESDQHWQWYGSCAPSTGVDLDVTLDGATLWHQAIPVCRSEIEDETVLTFKFAAPRPMSWVGCCINGHVATPKGRNIDGYIRFSGGAKDSDLIFDITFVDRNTQLMRTLHISNANSGHTGSFDGLIVQTSAVHAIDVPPCAKNEVYRNPIDGMVYCVPRGWQAYGPEKSVHPSKEKVVLGDVRLLQNQYVMTAHTDVAELAAFIKRATTVAADVFAKSNGAAAILVQFSITPTEAVVEMAAQGEPSQELLQTYYDQLKNLQPLKVSGLVKFQMTVKIDGQTH